MVFIFVQMLVLQIVTSAPPATRRQVALPLLLTTQVARHARLDSTHQRKDVPCALIVRLEGTRTVVCKIQSARLVTMVKRQTRDLWSVDLPVVIALRDSMRMIISAKHVQLVGIKFLIKRYFVTSVLWEELQPARRRSQIAPYVTTVSTMMRWVARRAKLVEQEHFQRATTWHIPRAHPAQWGTRVPAHRPPHAVSAQAASTKTRWVRRCARTVILDVILISRV